MDTNLLRVAFWVWVVEIAVSAINYFVLMRRVYAPRVGELRSHQIGMSTRIVYIFVAAGFLVSLEHHYSTADLVSVGLFWLGLTLVFEWGGSILTRRPVREILVGWHVERGYMWPYVLAAYLLSPLIVGELASVG
ncbi:hypothetical protein [Catenulispora subtropica]|uniref:Integral membrane protein n=1 Tax=Catenulispora subtropica TaxID=450798 RepID=A0ABN2TEC9_9ACTN